MVKIIENSAHCRTIIIKNQTIQRLTGQADLGIADKGKKRIVTAQNLGFPIKQDDADRGQII